MKAIDRRIRRLQGRLCPGNVQQHLWVLTQPGNELALDLDRCTEILNERGFLPKGRFGVVDLMGIPDGLNAKELEKYLRANEAGTCSSRREHKGPTDNGWPNQAQMASGGT